MFSEERRKEKTNFRKFNERSKRSKPCVDTSQAETPLTVNTSGFTIVAMPTTISSVSSAHMLTQNGSAKRSSGILRKYSN